MGRAHVAREGDVAAAGTHCQCARRRIRRVQRSTEHHMAIGCRAQRRCRASTQRHRAVVVLVAAAGHRVGVDRARPRHMQGRQTGHRVRIRIAKHRVTRHQQAMRAARHRAVVRRRRRIDGRVRAQGHVVVIGLHSAGVHHTTVDIDRAAIAAVDHDA